MYLSEIPLNLEDDLQDYGMVVLFAPTGSGKTTTMLDFAADKRMLYLVNREALYEEIVQRVEQKQLQNVTVETYQYLQNLNENVLKEFLMGYDVIVADECHYWVQDAQFNELTYYSFEALMQSTVPKTLITATGQSLFGLLASVSYKYKGTWDGQTRIWKTDRTFLGTKASFEEHEVIATDKDDNTAIIEASDYVKQFGINEFVLHNFVNEYRPDVMFHLVNKENFMNHLSGLPATEKAILFTDRLYQTEYRYGVFGYIGFLQEQGKTLQMVFSRAKKSECAAHNVEATRQELLASKTFSAQYLIATTTIDNGIDIEDDVITTIFCDFEGIVPVTVQQCIGRLRLGSPGVGTRLHVYIREHDAHALATKHGILCGQLIAANAFRKGILQKPDIIRMKKSGDLDKISKFDSENKLVLDELKLANLRYECDCTEKQSHYDTLRRQLAIPFENITSDIRDERERKRQEMMDYVDGFVKENFVNADGYFEERILDANGKKLIRSFVANLQPNKSPKIIKTINELFDEMMIPLNVTETRKNNIRCWTIRYASDVMFEKRQAGDEGEHYWKLIPGYAFDSEKAVWVSMHQIMVLVEDNQLCFRIGRDYRKEINLKEVKSYEKQFKQSTK